MGRIKKAAADKHGATLPPVLSEFVSSVTTSPIYELPQRLQAFPHHWPFPRGDLYHWIPVLDLFDEVLEEVVKLYNLQDGPQTVPYDRRYLLSKATNSEATVDISPKLDELHYGADGDRQLAESVLKFSRKLMDNCGNRSLYNSSERLHDLLHTTSLPLLLEILRLSSRLALSHYNINLDRVQRLAEPFPRLAVNPATVSSPQDATRKGKERLASGYLEQQHMLDPNNFVDMLKENSDEKAFAKFGSINFSYYQPNTPPGITESLEPINDDKAVSPTSPTPVRRSSGLSKQQKTQDSELAMSPERRQPNNATASEPGHKTLKIDNAIIKSNTVEEVLKQYLPQLPESTHFDFSSRVIVAKALSSGQQERLELIELRLLAIMNLAYIYPERDFQNKLLISDSDEPRRLQIVNQLADIIRPAAPGRPKLPITLRTTAISTLEALSKHKNRFGDVSAALQINVNHGIIFQILHEAIAELAKDDDDMYDEQAEDWRDALLSLLEMLPSIGSSSRTAETLIGAGFFDMLVKELELRSEKAERVHYKVLMFVITMSHLVRDALQTFANCKGFDVVSDLLAHEVRTAIEDVKSGKNIPEAHRSQLMDYQMTFFKQQTLRWLFKFINSMLSQQGGNVERLIRNLIDSPPLLSALRQVIESPKIFGANTWNGAVSVLSSFIHNEPTSYAVILEAGLSKTFLECVSQTPIQDGAEQSEPVDIPAGLSKVLKSGTQSIQVSDLITTDFTTETTLELSLKRNPERSLAAGILPSSELILQIPNAFNALCLNASGLDLFLKSGALDAYFEIFESPAHVKILAAEGNTAKLIGSNFDELIRHQPQLKRTIIQAIVVSLARVSYLCNQLSEPEELVNAATKSRTDDQADHHALTSESTRKDEESTVSNRDEPTAVDYLSVMVNFLNGFCENNSLCAHLVHAGAVEFLLDLATSPTLPYDLNSRSESDELARVFHSLIDSKPHLVLPAILVRLENSIPRLKAFIEHDGSKSIFWEYVQGSSIKAPDSDVAATLKALIEVHTLTGILQESLWSPTIATSRNSGSLFIQVNLADHWNSIVEGLLKIHCACTWDEVLLLRETSTPESNDSSSATQNKTARKQVDLSLGNTNTEDTGLGTALETTASPIDETEKSAEARKQAPARTNNEAARYLLSQVPLTTIALLQGLARSLVAKRRYDPYVRQNAYKLAETMVKCYMDQLLFHRAVTDNDLTSRTMFFKIILRGFNRLVIDNPHDRNHGQCMTLLLVMFKRHEYGLPRYNAMLNTFIEFVKDSQGNTILEGFALNGIRTVLDFYLQLVSSKFIVESTQSQTLQSSDRERDKEGYYYFSASQLLVDLRVLILTAVQPVWESLEAEKASVATLKGVMDIFRTVFECDHENGSRKRSDGTPMIMQPDHRTCHMSRDRLAALQARGAAEDLAREALFRAANNTNGAEEYCDMHLRHMGVPRLPPPEGDIRRESSAASLVASIVEAGPTTDLSASERSDESSLADESHVSVAPVAAVDNPTEAEQPPVFMLPISTSMEVDSDTNNQEHSTREVHDEDDDENGMAMSIDHQLNLSEPSTNELGPSTASNSITGNVRPRHSIRMEKVPALDVGHIDQLNDQRQSIRKDLVDRLIDVMSVHEGLTFDIADLIISSVKKASDADDMRKDVCETLIESLLSFMGADYGTYGKRIADRCNLLAVILQDDDFYRAAGSELREYFSQLINFLDIPTTEDHSTSSYPWMSQLLLLMEKLLAEDAIPVQVSWTAPIADADGNFDLPADHDLKLKVVDPKISLAEKRELLEAILRILPQVGKDAYLGHSIVRILVILTRSRELAEELGKKNNLQRLFLMVKQLAGIFDLEFQKTFMIVLRHIIEDEEIIKDVMRAEITTFWTSSRSPNRVHDLLSYTKAMAHMIMREPDVFVSVTSELVKIVSSGGDMTGRNGQYMLALRNEQTERDADTTNQMQESKLAENPNQETEASNTSAIPTVTADLTKAADTKMPAQEKPDGVIHWLLSQLLQYKEIEDKETQSSQTEAVPAETSDSTATATPPTANSNTSSLQSTGTRVPSEKKPEKTEWVGEQHPHFHYRCFLLETLTELLYSYQCAKLEFVNFKQDSKATAPATPSKPRSTVLNYLLTRLIPVGTLVKAETVNMKKKDAQSQWAISMIVALCLKSSHTDSNKHDYHEDTDANVDGDLTYIRKFVLENSYKAFKDATTIEEPLDSKYGRLLNLADLFCRLLLGRAMPKNFYNTGSSAVVRKGLAKIMFEKNYIAMLTNAIADLDLNYPNSRRAVKYILRPLKLLTETAIELSQNAEILSTPGTTEEESISVASSVSDIDMDREDTPDLFRNSTLGILEPGRDRGQSTDSDDEEEEIYESGYDDEMDYDEEIDHDEDEVVSDEDEELDDAGPLEGLAGDHPMDVEVIIDDDDDDDDDSDEDDTDDDLDDEEMGDDEALGIFEQFSDPDEEASHPDGAEDEWEDEDSDNEHGDTSDHDDDPPPPRLRELEEILRDNDPFSVLAMGSSGPPMTLEQIMTEDSVVARAIARHIPPGTTTLDINQLDLEAIIEEEGLTIEDIIGGPVNIGGPGTNDDDAMQQAFMDNFTAAGREQSNEPNEALNLTPGRIARRIRSRQRQDDGTEEEAGDEDQLTFAELTNMNTAVMHDDEDDGDDDDEDDDEGDMGEEDVEPDYDDEGDAPPWGWDETEDLIGIPPPRHHNHHHHHHHHHHHWEGAGRRNPWTLYPPDDERGLVPPGYRQHGRSGGESASAAGAHPLLRRTQSPGPQQSSHSREPPANYADFLNLLARDRRSAGGAMNLINSMIGAMDAGGVLDLAGRNGTLHVQIASRDGAVALPFPTDDMLRMLTHPRPQPTNHRQSRHYDHSLVPRFMPARTVNRWRFEAMILCGGDDYFKRAQGISKAIEKALVPASLEELKQKKIEERKAMEEEKAKEEAAQKKAEEERLAKEKIEKEAREQREREEKEAAEREDVARAAGPDENEEGQDEVMQGVETQAIANDNTEAQEATSTEADHPRVIATFRGREVDISGLGIDLEYLDALPDELREEVLMQQLAEQRSQAVATGQDGDEISPEFLAALPEDIRQELLQQEARERRRREHAEARRQAQANGQAPRGEEMDTASFLASLDPNLRASVLVDQGEDILDHLPPAIAAEARALGADRARYIGGIGGARLGINPGFVHENGDDPTTKKPKRQIVQMLDKAGVATLLRLLFISQQGNGKDILNDILRNISLNRQNRAEVVGLLLIILQEGSIDAAAVEKSFAQLTLRAKQNSSAQKTPLKRSNTGLSNSSLALDMSPASIIQQCLSTLVFLTRENIHVTSLFLTESEGLVRSKVVRKIKSKDSKASRFALNGLLSLLDRSIILDSAACMEQLSTLLQHITQPLTMLARKDKKGPFSVDAESKPDETPEASAASAVVPNETQPTEELESTQSAPTAGTEHVAHVDAESDQKVGDNQAAEPSNVEDSAKKQRNLIPPVVPEENLRLVVGILAARECSAKTFRDTVTTISNLSAMPGAKEIFGQELITQAQQLGRLISDELDELSLQIEQLKDNTDAQAVPAMTKFATPAADQAKLLRILTALDYLFDPKRNPASEASQAGSSKDVEDTLAGLYEGAAFGPLWSKLSECLTAIKDKKHVLNVATILLPLIEALMVICKNTATSSVAAKPTKEIAITSPEPEALVENLFFRFTEEHRKILNELVRHNPRLMSGTFSLLVKNPKVLEFDNKRNYFTRRLHSRGDQRRSQPPLNVPVRRDFTFSDSFQALYFKSPDEIKYGKLNIRFHGEEGIDAGGVTREWFQVMSRQMFNEDYALFSPVASDRTTFHPNKLSRINEAHLMWFKFIGRIIGKALYEGRALDCYFSRAVYKTILGKSVSVKDMESLDLEYYKSLIWMLENDITELIDQTFSVENEVFGVTEVVDLIPDGRNIAVTEDNKQEYVQLIVEYRLTGSVKDQLNHFLEGFNDIVPAELINIFNEQELELLISGLPEIDVEDWKNHTDYHQYTVSSPQIQWFWRAIRSFDKEERAKLLQFVTGTSKVPLNGFRELEGMNGFTRFNIHRDYGNKDRLPSSHTCFNQLDLPEYESYETLRQRLYTAITTGSDYFGFA